jgi:hypothetical protein|nr:MAG TPA: hypothetical protein [Caudoviricetes sp.]
MKNKKMETSKKIILFIGILFAVAIVYTIVSCSISLIMNTYTDWTSIVALLTSTGGAFGTACGFYYSKAKSENNYKLRMAFLKEKYTILKEIGALDENRAKMEIENELDTINGKLDMEAEEAMSIDNSIYQDASSTTI